MYLIYKLLISSIKFLEKKSFYKLYLLLEQSDRYGSLERVYRVRYMENMIRIL